MTRLFFLLAALLTGGWLAADDQWVTTHGAETPYDTGIYLTGYGVSPVEGKTAAGAQASARDEALKAAAEKLKVRVDASSKLTDSEFGTANFSSYQSDVKAQVSLDLGGVETYQTAFDPDQNRWVALAVVSKTKMLEFLQTQRTGQISVLESDLKEVKALADRQATDKLLKSLETFELHLDNLTQNVVVARLLGEPVAPETLLQRFYNAKDQVRAGVLSQKLLTTGDVVKFLVKAFDWHALAGKTVALVPAVYKTSSISGEYLEYLKSELADALDAQFPSVRQVYATPDLRPDFILKGSYFEAGDGWHLVFKLTDTAKKVLTGTTEFDLDADFVKSQPFPFLPPNINVALADREVQVAVYDNPVPTELKAWTNKGSDGLVFHDGEYVDFSIQSNRPGYVTILYNMAGPKRLRVPIMENIPIFPKDIGKPVKIERQGPFAAPFGSESAQFFFSSQKIPPFQTTNVTIEGVTYPVLSEDYAKVVVATRGLGGIKATQNTEPDPYKTDFTLAITTVPKDK